MCAGHKLESARLWLGLAGLTVMCVLMHRGWRVSLVSPDKGGLLHLSCRVRYSTLFLGAPETGLKVSLRLFHLHLVPYTRLRGVLGLVLWFCTGGSWACTACGLLGRQAKQAFCSRPDRDVWAHALRLVGGAPSLP